MELPFESTINTAIEKIADGVITKVNINEERRNREFTYQLKELEFYKSNYEKDLKAIFDYWFEVVRLTHIKDNARLTEEARKRCQKRLAELMNLETVAKYKMNTLKYGGTETGRVLALQNKLLQPEYSDQPKEVALYIWCKILSVLKKDILGQYIDPLDIIQILVNDYDANEEKTLAAKEYVEKLYRKTYGSR